MTVLSPGQIALQVRIGFIRVGVMPCLIALTLMLGAGTWIWLAAHTEAMEDRQKRALVQVRHALRETSNVGVVVQGSTAEQNLQNFYAALGDPAETEQHLKTLFSIATETGLQLDQGEYKWEFEQNSRTYRHQILLPVKGSYSLIRQFCEKTLLALPFASLDELSFKRESIGEDAPDASLRFTIYLKDMPRALQEAAAAKS